jgi:3-deoxy-D-manno-octulosonic-acid transferase
VKSLEPILQKIKSDFTISTITKTGFIEATKLSNDVRFLPFEVFLPFWLKKIETLVVIEAELWYMLFFVAKQNGAKTILINARISDKSYPKYLKFKWLYRRIFANIDTVVAQSDSDRDKLISLGAKDVRVFGNIKLAKEIKITKEYPKPTKEVVILASSHDGEEELFLDSIVLENRITLIAPRHPERFKDVEVLLKNRNLNYSLFSKSQALDSDIILIDTLGELINLYAIADIVVMGGTYADIGGHNIVEPATFGCKIVSGLNYYNQKELYKMVSGVNIGSNLKELLNGNLIHSKVTKKLNIDEICTILISD